MKPATDVRDDSFDEHGVRITKIRSRIGLEAVADVIAADANVLDIVKEKFKQGTVSVIIVDECQFLQPEQVDQLKYISEFIDIPVLCFGLRTDFQSKLFPGSQRLFELASSIQEIKHVCNCGQKSIINARIDENGKIVTEGAQVEIGGNDKYEAMCWKCWMQNRQDEFVI
jgi:thymidine kinase